MYLGGVLTILSYPLWGTVSPPVAILLGGMMLAPGGIDGTTQMFGDRESTNRLRAVTGLFLGIGTVAFVYGVVALSYTIIN
jgi:uncharacterized membrane protein